jgi:uncharacterized protein (TIGR00255 family)
MGPLREGALEEGAFARMRSMTGYGSRDFVYDGRAYAIDLKSYNNRYLEIALSLHPSLSRLERDIRSWLQDRVRRGSVELKIWPKSKAASASYAINESAARAAADALRALAKLTGLRSKPSLSDLLSFEGVLDKDVELDREGIWQSLLVELDRCFDEFDAMRVSEGMRTAKDIEKSLARLKAALALVMSRALAMEEALKAEVLARFKEVLGEEVDEKRALAEAAALLLKSSVNEECARLSSHLESFEAEMRRERQRGEGIGKKLDFLCQEINREVNTIGSKSISIEIDQSVVEMKDAVENIREQLRNLE